MTILTSALAALLFFSSARASENNYYVGEEVQVCRAPDQAEHRSDLNGKPYFLKYNRKTSSHSETYLTVVVWSADLQNLEINPLTYFSSEDFCLAGKISDYKGENQLVVRDLDQIVISKK